MRKLHVAFIIFLVVSFFLSGCVRYRYSEQEIIGLTSREIIEKYGDFDRTIHALPNADGLYCNCACGYLIAEARKGFLGTTPPEYFMISFDENGIAIWCGYEQVV